MCPLPSANRHLGSLPATSLSLEYGGSSCFGASFHFCLTQCFPSLNLGAELSLTYCWEGLEASPTCVLIQQMTALLCASQHWTHRARASQLEEGSVAVQGWEREQGLWSASQLL